MSTNVLFYIELGLVHGAVLAFAFWELYKLRRDKRRDEAAASAKRAGHAEGQHPADEGRPQAR